MDKRTVVITERDGKYEIQNDGIAEFELIGLLECIIFDLKNARRVLPVVEVKEAVTEPKGLPAEPKQSAFEPQEAAPKAKREAVVVREPGAADLRVRIGNAVKAIRGLGGEVIEIDLSGAGEEELRTELEELTNQYKRLKTSKGTTK